MNTVADDWLCRMTNAISGSGTGSRTLWIYLREDEGLGTSEKDIEKALLNPDADASVKQSKASSRNRKRKKLIDSMKAFGESASFDSLTSKKGACRWLMRMMRFSTKTVTR